MATRHDGIEGQGQWLAQVLRGWMAYYAVPMSGSALSAFRHHMIELWQSQPAATVDGGRETTSTCLFHASCIRGLNRGSSSPSKARARCVSSARRDLRGGRRVISVSTATSPPRTVVGSAGSLEGGQP